MGFPPAFGVDYGAFLYTYPTYGTRIAVRIGFVLGSGTKEIASIVDGTGVYYGQDLPR